MPTAKVHNLEKKEVGEVSLPDSVFGVEFNEPLVHAAVRNYLANARQGTSATKTRGNVRGGGRKPWRQKGTGRARVASIRSPLWRGGGKTHGPQPRDWSYSIPKKMRHGALRSALSERLREGNIMVIDSIEIAEPKTRKFVSVMDKLGLHDSKKPVKVLIIDSLDNQNLVLSSRNVKKTKVTNGFGVNIYDLLYHEKLVISRAAIDELTSILDPEQTREDSKVTGSGKKADSKKSAKPKAAKTKQKPKKKSDGGKATSKSTTAPEKGADKEEKKSVKSSEKKPKEKGSSKKKTSADSKKKSAAEEKPAAKEGAKDE